MQEGLLFPYETVLGIVVSKVNMQKSQQKSYSVNLLLNKSVAQSVTYFE